MENEKIEERIEKIVEVVNELAGIEKEGAVHRWAVIKPKLNERNDLEKHLDTFARLLTGINDTCVAICHDEKGRSIFIASNGKEATYAKENLNKFSEFIKNDCSLLNYWKLIELAIEKVYLFKIKGEGTNQQRLKTKSQELKKSEPTLLKEFKLLITDYHGSKLKRENEIFSDNLNINELEKILNSAKNLSKEISEGKGGNYWEWLIPVDDVNIIANAIKNDELDKDLRKMIEENNNIDYVIGKEGVHAEMKIINKFIKNKMNENYYIGISKLTCASCQITIDVFKSEFKNSVRTNGTHGGTYKNWLIPDKINEMCGEQVLKELKKKLLYGKGKETTSEIQKNGLTNYLEKITDQSESENMDTDDERTDAANMDVDNSNFREETTQLPYGKPSSSK